MAVHSLNQSQIESVSARCDDTQLATAITLSFARDWSSGEDQRALRLTAPVAISRFGLIELQYSAPWATTKKEAYSLAARILQHRARPLWRCEFDAPALYQRVQIGETIAVSHPLLPVASLFVIAVEASDGGARIAGEYPAGTAPAVSLGVVSEAFAPQVPDGIASSVENGVATFTIILDGKPEAGAIVTIEGRNYTANASGVVSVSGLARGTYTATITTADGERLSTIVVI